MPAGEISKLKYASTVYALAGDSTFSMLTYIEKIAMQRNNTVILVTALPRAFK